MIPTRHIIIFLATVAYASQVQARSVKPNQDGNWWKRTVEFPKSYDNSESFGNMETYKYIIKTSTNLAVTQLTDLGFEIISEIVDKTLEDYGFNDIQYRSQTSCYAGKLARRLIGEPQFDILFEEYAFNMRKNKYIALFREGLRGMNNCTQFNN